MLSTREKDLVRALVAGLGGSAGDGPIVALLADLPPRPGALALAREELERTPPDRVRSVGQVGGLVRELVHAADYRLRLSALALFARTDPAAALAVVRPLIAECHPTLTGGIALLLGDLTAQPVAADLLVELAALETDPRVKRLVGE